jgi:hypothetical protein
MGVTMTSEVIQKYENLSRGTGRTTALINSLPRDGTKAYVFVHSYSFAKILKDKFDPYDTDVIFLVASSWENINSQMKGRRGEIYIDHFLLTAINKNLLDELNKMYKAPVEPKYSATVSDLTKENLNKLCQEYNVTYSEKDNDSN